MLGISSLNGRRLVRAMFMAAVAGTLFGCASDPPPALSPISAPGTTAATPPAAAGTATSTMASARRAKSARTKPAKIPKNVVPDEAAAIEAGKDACHPISDTYAKEHWRAQNQHGVWRVWVTPVHCEGGGTCPTYEVHVTAADGVAGECTQRVALN